MEARKAGYERGIMRQQPQHAFIVGTTPAREFMEGFAAGRKQREWLDARGMKRVRQVVEKSTEGGWHWEIIVEHGMVAQGWAKSQKAASQAAEDAASEVN